MKRQSTPSNWTYVNSIRFTNPRLLWPKMQLDKRDNGSRASQGRITKLLLSRPNEHRRTSHHNRVRPTGDFDHHIHDAARHHKIDKHRGATHHHYSADIRH